jgi:hypothetical protein
MPCVCEHSRPYTDADDERRCFRCGRPVVDLEDFASSGNGHPEPDPEPAAGDVPWTVAQETELRQLIRNRETSAWAIGDAALAAVPIGKSKANAGASSSCASWPSGWAPSSRRCGEPAP